MGLLLSYSIIGGLLMLAMYLVYRLLLARDNQHGFNRIVLLTIYLVSFAAAPIFSELKDIATAPDTGLSTLGDVEIAGTAAIPTTKPVWGTILIWIFIAGMAIVATKTLITWFRLTNVIRKGEKIAYGSYVLVVTDNEKFAPFSWMRYIVISRRDYENGCSAIAIHEQKHVACRHWIDLMIAQAVCIINWFNPAAWLMRDELMLVHEYQADMAVIDSGHDTQEYQMLLIKKAVGARFPSLANSLNHSKLKKRITMMYKEKSGAGRKLKALALVPVLALTLGLAAVPAVRAAVSTISSSGVSVSKGSENPPQDKTSVKTFKVTNINNNGYKTTVKIKAEGLGNSLTVSGGTFTTDGKTYHANSLSCNMTDGKAEIIAEFPFTSEYDKPSMTLTVNGEEIPFDLEKFFDNAQTVTVGGNPDSAKSAKVIHINGKLSSLPKDMTIILDGKVVSESEFMDFPTANIASVTIDHQTNTIRIKSR